MHILYFIEPEFELDDPFLKGNWASEWIPRLSSTAEAAFGSALRQTVVLNDAIEDLLPSHVPAERLVVPQNGTADLLKDDLAKRRAHLALQPRGQAGQRKAEWYRQRLANSPPDIIVSLSEGGFLANAFPGAVVLHHEFSLFSRSPMPQAWFFDPTGPFCCSWLDRLCRAQQWNWAPDAAQKDATARIVEAYRTSALSGFSDSAAELAAQRSLEGASLLALQNPGFTLYGAHMPVQSQLQIALGVLANLPTNHHLVISEHPYSPSLGAAARRYLTERDERIMFLDTLIGSGSPSDAIVASVDQIIASTSKAAGLGLMWNVPFVSLADTPYSCFASTDILSRDGPAPALPSKRREALLAWILLNVQTGAEQLSDPQWLGGLFTQALDRHRSGDQWLKPLIQPWKSPEATADYWVTQIERNGRETAAREVARRFCRAAGHANWNTVEELYSKVLQAMADLTKPEDIVELGYFIAMTDLNHRGDYESARTGFKKAMEGCESAERAGPVAPQITQFYWLSAFHQAYSCLFAGNKVEAKRLATERLATSSTSFGPMPADLRDRFHELLV